MSLEVVNGGELPLTEKASNGSEILKLPVYLIVSEDVGGWSRGCHVSDGEDRGGRGCCLYRLLGLLVHWVGVVLRYLQSDTVTRLLRGGV